MTREVTVEYLDDLTGEPATGTVVFGYGGRWYELDLTDANTDHVEGVLSDWAAHARVQNGDGDGPVGRSSASRQRSADIRVWAQANGWDLAPRGRIPIAAVTAYQSR